MRHTCAKYTLTFYLCVDHRSEPSYACACLSLSVLPLFSSFPSVAHIQLAFIMQVCSSSSMSALSGLQ